MDVREQIAREIETMVTPESGPDYGMATDQERAETRATNRTIRAIAERVRRNSNSKEH